MVITIPQVAQYAAYLALLIIAGGLEYFKLIPGNSTAGVFFLIVGHFFGNSPTAKALARTSQAPKTTAEHASPTLHVPTGPIHLVLHYETPPAPIATPAPSEPQPIILQKPTS